MGYQKNSPFAEMFDYHIEKLRQTGVLDNIKTKYQGLEQKCPDLRLVVELFSITFQGRVNLFECNNRAMAL